MMDAVAQQFGENLRRCRKSAGISQEELGFRSSLHRTEIGLLERGARVPRIDTLIKIATGLGVQYNALLVGIVWTRPTDARPTGSFTRISRSERYRESLKKAAELRARQKGPFVDAVELIREGRRELTERATRWMDDDEEA
jgi:transcriptional regulator with XRE-family HTH domain